MDTAKTKPIFLIPLILVIVFFIDLPTQTWNKQLKTSELNLNGMVLLGCVDYTTHDWLVAVSCHF